MLHVNGHSLKNRLPLERKVRQPVPFTARTQLASNHQDSSTTVISPKNTELLIPQRTARTTPTAQRSFDFMLGPYTTYPVESFQPTLPQRCFMANPLYTFSRFKRQLLSSNIDLTTSLKAATKHSQRNLSTQRSTKRATTMSTRVQIQDPEQTLNFSEIHGKVPYYIGELQFEDPEGKSGNKPVIVALEPKCLFFNKKTRRSKSHYQGPNFPFNLNYMLSHLKNKKASTPAKPTFQQRDPQEYLRPFTSNVYKRRSNNVSRQFYTDCLRICEGRPSTPRSLSLKPSTSKPIDPGQPRINIKNKEVSILQNIFTRHKPNRRQHISLSELQ